MIYVACTWCQKEIKVANLVANDYCPLCFHRHNLPPEQCDCPLCWRDLHTFDVPDPPTPLDLQAVPDLPTPLDLQAVPDLPDFPELPAPPSIHRLILEDPIISEVIDATPMDDVQVVGRRITNPYVELTVFESRVILHIGCKNDPEQWVHVTLGADVVEAWHDAMGMGVDPLAEDGGFK